MKKKEDDKVVLIFGATGCGKSELIAGLFEKYSVSLVSVDSIQVYKGLDIGSAKPSRDFMSRYPHYLVDIREPFGSYTVADFVEDADAAVDDSYAKGRVPLLSGGTAYYFKHFVYGLSSVPEVDASVRDEVSRMEADRGLPYLYERLSVCDPESSSRINPNDSYRIKRAVEVFMQTGRKLSSFDVPAKPRRDVQAIGLYRNRDDLRKRISDRLDRMFANGLVEEVEGLKKMGLTLSNQSMSGIGYREFFDDSLGSVREIREKIYYDTVHYAKRQMTFFRSFGNVRWVDLSAGEDLLTYIHF